MSQLSPKNNDYRRRTDDIDLIILTGENCNELKITKCHFSTDLIFLTNLAALSKLTLCQTKKGARMHRPVAHGNNYFWPVFTKSYQPKTP